MADITLIRNVGLDDTATSGDTSTVGEPSVDAVNRQLFVTGNWYASRSTDNGASWTHVDPFNALPSTAGGFCCDQLTIHDDARGVWIWILQYSTASGTNVFRLAATRDADFPTGGWYWWDIGPQTLDGSWSNLWFDYPDAALTNDNLFVTFNVFDAADDWQRAHLQLVGHHRQRLAPPYPGRGRDDVLGQPQHNHPAALVLLGGRVEHHQLVERRRRRVERGHLLHSAE